MVETYAQQSSWPRDGENCEPVRCLRSIESVALGLECTAHSRPASASYMVGTQVAKGSSVTLTRTESSATVKGDGAVPSGIVQIVTSAVRVLLRA